MVIFILLFIFSCLLSVFVDFGYVEDCKDLNKSDM